MERSLKPADALNQAHVTRGDHRTSGWRALLVKRRRLFRVMVLGALCVPLLAIGLWWKLRLPGAEQVHDFASEQRRKLRVLSFAREAPDAPAGAVVFLGSSTFYHFPLEEAYPAATCLNRGLGFDSFAKLSARLDASLPVARPSGVVVYAGSNDVRAERLPPSRVLVDAAALLSGIDAHFPGVPIAVVEALPAVVQSPEETAGLAAVNEGLRDLASSRGAAFVRTNRPPLVAAPGQLSAAMALPDGIHLNRAGYAVLARWIAGDGGAATASLRGPVAPP